jgi:DNA-binding MarR family transcriptional regulator
VSDPARPANALGALALVITDRGTAAAAEAAGLSLSAAAALSILSEYLEDAGPVIDRLRSILGLTGSGTVRLVDRLEKAGLVRRTPGLDGRTRSVELTAAGRQLAGRVREARMAYLDALVDGLTPEETETLSALIGKVMTAVVEEKDGGAWICRLCDLEACQRPAHRCPAENAARAKRGLPPWDWDPKKGPPTWG